MRGGPITNLCVQISGLYTWFDGFVRARGESGRDGEYLHRIDCRHGEGGFLRVPEGPEGFLGRHF
jgi:hypothetical protein